MEMMQALVISTAHVSFDDIQRLEMDSDYPDAALQVFNGHYGLCFMVPTTGSFTEEETSKRYSESVTKVVDLARERDAKLVVLDRDGEVLDDQRLDVHDW